MSTPNLTADSKQVDAPNPTGKGGFTKGKSGNPGGRPKMPAEVREMLLAKANEAVQVITKFLSDSDPRVALKAAELLLDRAYGKPVSATEAVTFDVPDDTGGPAGLVTLHAALIRATACGQLAVADAMDFSGLFENHRRMIETSDLDARIAKLENEMDNE